MKEHSVRLQLFVSQRLNLLRVTGLEIHCNKPITKKRVIKGFGIFQSHSQPLSPLNRANHNRLLQ